MTKNLIRRSIRLLALLLIGGMLGGASFPAFAQLLTPVNPNSNVAPDGTIDPHGLLLRTPAVINTPGCANTHSCNLSTLPDAGELKNNNATVRVKPLGEVNTGNMKSGVAPNGGGGPAVTPAQSTMGTVR